MGAIGAPYRLDLVLNRTARVPVLPCPYNGAWQESTRSNDLTPDLLAALAPARGLRVTEGLSTGIATVFVHRQASFSIRLVAALRK
jgi:hypothetical protein